MTAAEYLALREIIRATLADHRWRVLTPARQREIADQIMELLGSPSPQRGGGGGPLEPL